MTDAISTDCCPPPSAPSPVPIEGPAFAEELARLAKALGHPTRIAILQILKKRDACVCGEIVEELPLAQSTVSQHLKVLKDAGLIRGRIEGPRVCYCLEPAQLERLKVLFRDL